MDPPGEPLEGANGVAVSPDGGSVYVTGSTKVAIGGMLVAAEWTVTCVSARCKPAPKTSVPGNLSDR